MFLRIKVQLSIDNLNDHPIEVVRQLEALLTSGVEARLDPKRKHFYEVAASDRVFFIHAVPALQGMLLATWLTELPVAELVAGASGSCD
jgi:hypothetical protein